MLKIARVKASLVLGFTLALGNLLNQLAFAATPNFSSGKDVVVSDAQQYDFTSHITGRAYRIFVAAPSDALTRHYPVIYVLDGNRDFLEASNLRQERVLVGIGYPPGEDPEVRRFLELTPTSDTSRNNPGPTGDGDNFLRVIQDEIKPFVESHYRVDKTKQALYGHSLAGLAVLRQLFLHPEAYTTYVAASPSIWWDNKVLLNDEATFAARISNGASSLRLLVLSAAKERLENASELAERLAALNPAKLQVSRQVIADEEHGSSIPASLARGLQFAMPQN